MPEIHLKPPLDLASELAKFYNKLAASQEPMPPEFQKVIDDNFWDLLIKDEDLKHE